MSNSQKQNLLAYLGYYVGDIDGIWGTLSKTAMTAFTKDASDLGIPVDDLEKALRHAVANDLFKSQKPPDESTGDFWDEIEYFTREEFRCKCGGRYCNGFPAEPKENLVRIADQLRKNLGVPIDVISGLRCETWNRLQGGVDNSQHKFGEAMDIRARGKSQAVVEAELDRIGGVRYHDPIKNSSNVHFDIPKGAR